jgi:hypothetical protein
MPKRAVMHERSVVRSAALKIWEDSGLGEDLVHSSPPALKGLSQRLT